MPGMIRRLFIGLIGTATLFALLYAAGPVHRLDTALAPLELPSTPEALERQLSEAERRLGDVVPGTEKYIQWAYADRRRTALSIVYLHGYSATRQEVDPLCDELARALGANVFYTRLAGHGRASAAMGEVTGNDWLNDAAEALAIGQKIGERVILVGTSTGGTLALWLAQQGLTEAVAAQILISPNLGPKARASELLAGPWGAQLLALLVGEEYRWQPLNEDHAKYWTWRYPARALLPMMAVVRTVREAGFERVRVPTLTIYSPNDRVVDASRILETHQRLGADVKPLLAIERSGDPSNHVLAGRVLAPADTPKLRRKILEFLREISLTTDAA
jgi:esterase/lipase